MIAIIRAIVVMTTALAIAAAISVTVAIMATAITVATIIAIAIAIAIISEKHHRDEHLRRLKQGGEIPYQFFIVAEGMIDNLILERNRFVGSDFARLRSGVVDGFGVAVVFIVRPSREHDEGHHRQRRNPQGFSAHDHPPPVIGRRRSPA